MKKRILASTLVIVMVAVFLLAQTAMGAYYVTSSGQKIGYNLGTTRYYNYYPISRSRLIHNTKPDSNTDHTNYYKLDPQQHSVSPYTRYTVPSNYRVYYPLTTSNPTTDHHQVTPVPQQTQQQDAVEQKPQTETPATNDSSHQVSEDELKLIQLINQERVNAGLKPLEIDYQLCKVARIKSEDMRTQGYFSHTSPTYGSPFKMMKDFGISYRSAAENIGRTYSVERAHSGFMNSEGHRNNILNPNFTHVGVGISGNYYTEMFIQKY